MDKVFERVDVEAAKIHEKQNITRISFKTCTYKNATYLVGIPTGQVVDMIILRTHEKFTRVGVEFADCTQKINCMETCSLRIKPDFRICSNDENNSMYISGDFPASIDVFVYLITHYDLLQDWKSEQLMLLERKKLTACL